MQESDRPRSAYLFKGETVMSSAMSVSVSRRRQNVIPARQIWGLKATADGLISEFS